MRARRLERVLGLERRQQARQAAGEHRLARARRPEQQQVVTAGRRDLDGEPPEALTAHVGHVGGRRGLGHGLGGVGRVGPGTVALQRVDNLSQVLHGAHRAGGDERRLRVRARRHDERARRHGGHEADDPRDRAQRPVEAELAEEAETGHRFGRYLVGGDEHADRDSEVKPGSGLA